MALALPLRSAGRAAKNSHALAALTDLGSAGEIESSAREDERKEKGGWGEREKQQAANKRGRRSKRRIREEEAASGE
jgi:hypothetical protein